MMDRSVLAYYQVLVVLLIIIHSTNAFSVSSSDGGINIVGLGGGQTQSLPGMYVNVSVPYSTYLVLRCG